MSELVEQLRACGKTCHEAADEIERLYQELHVASRAIKIEDIDDVIQRQGQSFIEALFEEIERGNIIPLIRRI